MQLAIYRSVTHTIYPEEALTDCYAFQPIPSQEQTREGLLMGWTSDSGPEPFAVIEIPDDCRITNSEDGWQLQMPDIQFLIYADEVYELAMDQFFGLSIVQGPRSVSQQDFWCSSR
jgi:hypothetical protein